MAFKDPEQAKAYYKAYREQNRGALAMKAYQQRRDPKKLAQKREQNRRYRAKKKAEKELKILEIKDTTKDEFF